VPTDDLDAIEAGAAAPGASGPPSATNDSPLGPGGGPAAAGGIASAVRGGAAGAGRTAAALAGESVADFAARQGVDPTAWRAIAAQLDGSTIALPAGRELDFSAALGAASALGAHAAGVEAGIARTLDAAYGLEAAAGTVGREMSNAAGFALAAAGGVAAAIAAVQSAKADAAANAARDAFAAPAMPDTSSGPPSGPTPPTQSRPALRGDVRGPGLAAQQDSPRVPTASSVDMRATSFGFGVPLRRRRSEAATARTNTMQGAIALRPRMSSEVARARDPGAAPWTQLPDTTALSAVASPSAPRLTRSGRCGCGCSERGGGGAR
jgi:hypothetical protein